MFCRSTATWVIMKRIKDMSLATLSIILLCSQEYGNVIVVAVGLYLLTSIEMSFLTPGSLILKVTLRQHNMYWFYFEINKLTTQSDHSNAGIHLSSVALSMFERR